MDGPQGEIRDDPRVREGITPVSRRGLSQVEGGDDANIEGDLDEERQDH